MEMFFRRFCAYMIDTVILIVCVYLLDMIIKGIFTNANEYYVIRIIFYNIISILYFSIQECSDYQATLGKRVLNIFVCDLTGDPISFKQALLRNIFRYINFFICSLGYLTIFFTKNKQCLHDLLSKTIVAVEEVDD